MLLKPHRLLLILSLILCASQLIKTFIWGDTGFDVPINDTFYVFDSFHITLVLFLLFLGMAFFYKLGDQSQFQYNKWLTLGHFASITLFIITFSKLTLVSSNIPRRYYSFDTFAPLESIYENIDFLNNCLFIFALLIVFFFVLNLVMGYFKRKIIE